MTNFKVWIPLILLLLIILLFFFGLKYDPNHIPSVKLNKKAPEFILSSLKDKLNQTGNKVYTSESWKGKTWILNVFASWCAACNTEHPVLMKLARDNPEIQVIGLAYKDKPLATQEWLLKNGNPYNVVLIDQNGKVGIDYGVYGVPETFVIDSIGFIRHRHVGPINSTFYQDYISPYINLNFKIQK
tara:strand:+ start:1035 stop:1592 length:558 start_codon:yes stop_codon:yes gene_type:complete